ncbi:hypothetical protein OG874_03735 [Nocardia sp. NBC_00565]|uniref:hypothetical protein n=1 Tax=Nocardia sp. NBC_00565 TaxID=2975993 RepID=UPI002E805040|nr:hypothetical protein [Nocardia sp. NBC_00565]WUC04330.1 hypothetical protein OG874_03735 [Nocardia sp. NBC_00565]
MITFLVSMAVVVGFAVLIAQGCGHAGSGHITDRDAQRMQTELSAIYAHGHHR